MSRMSDLHKKWMKDAKYRKAYAALEDEFALFSRIIQRRADLPIRGRRPRRPFKNLS